MSKLNTRPSPNPKEDSPAFLRDNSGSDLSHEPYGANAGYGASVKAESVKRKRNFDVVDAQALYALYPQFFKLVPDYAKIRQAIKLGLAMPGVVFDGSEISEETEAQNYQGE